MAVNSMVEEWINFAVSCVMLAFWIVIVVFILFIIGVIVEIKTGRGWL